MGADHQTISTRIATSAKRDKLAWFTRNRQISIARTPGIETTGTATKTKEISTTQQNIGVSATRIPASCTLVARKTLGGFPRNLERKARDKDHARTPSITTTGTAMERSRQTAARGTDQPRDTGKHSIQKEPRRLS